MDVIDYPQRGEDQKYDYFNVSIGDILPRYTCTEDSNNLTFIPHYRIDTERLGELSQISISSSATDYYSLWSIFMDETNTVHEISDVEKIVSTANKLKSTLKLKAALEMLRASSANIGFQTKAVKPDLCIGIEESLLFTFAQTQQYKIKHGVEWSEEMPDPVLADRRKFNSAELFKWLYSYKIDVDINQLLSLYKNNSAPGLLSEKRISIEGGTGIFDHFFKAQAYMVGRSVSFLISPPTDGGVPLFILASWAQSSLGIGGFLLLRYLSNLFDFGLISLKCGIIYPNKELNFLSSNIFEKVSSWHKHQDVSSLLGVYHSFTKAIEPMCPSCGEPLFFNTRGALCFKCYLFVSRRYGKHFLGNWELTIGICTGKIRTFKYGKFMLLYKRQKIANSYYFGYGDGVPDV